MAIRTIRAVLLTLILLHLPPALGRDCGGEELLFPKNQLRMETAKRLGLTQSEDGDFTIRRVLRRGKFIYVDTDGDTITNKKTLARIASVKIRPDLLETRISDDPRGHIQAIGVDESGRQQYIYHPLWEEVRKTVKFDSTLPAFAEAIPTIREVVEKDLRGKVLDEKRLVAGVVRLLDETLIRVGNQEYATRNKSYGLTTLLKSHVEVSGSKVTFTFNGKSGVAHSIEYADPQIAKLIAALLKAPGRNLFKFTDEDGEWENVDSDSVNDYLRRVTKSDFTAKDFRTWGGTVAAAEYLQSIDHPNSQRGLEKAFAEASKAAAEELENTPAVSRSSYIHPKIFTLYKDDAGAFRAAFAKAKSRLARKSTGRTLGEEAVFIILTEN